MPVNKILLEVTDRIIERSKESREKYVDRMKSSFEKGPRRAHLSCGNQAHAYAAMGLDKETLANITIQNSRAQTHPCSFVSMSLIINNHV